ncbi:hypothetical protein WR25_07415 [Diploscapter pachys]|uniref:RING-type domain-containing protein n=1 Tax=Diploscapter pachys TaxID=2018661 RepID=A0A2A2KR29_9BILA|nr:hypothetical protein WR25_07415 [Diploscapter pachys]
MELVHCMGCFTFVNSSGGPHKFGLTSCEHIFCATCLANEANRKECLVCKTKDFKIMEIGSKMPLELRELFTPMEDTLASSIQLIKEVAKFQAEHARIQIELHKKKAENYEKLKNYAKQEINKKNEYKKQLQSIRNQLKLAQNPSRAALFGTIGVSGSPVRRSTSTSRAPKGNDRHRSQAPQVRDSCRTLGK